MQESVYPRRGWGRAISYLKLRLHRLPDTPHKIARGVFAGIFMCFTPLFGLHIILAALISLPLRGNVVAAVLATFFGNPITFPFITVGSLSVGHFLLGKKYAVAEPQGLLQSFRGAGADLKDNFIALFTEAHTDWTRLGQFFHEVYLPYLVGGVVLGLIAGSVAFYMTVPVITAYQKRRKGRLRKKLTEMRAAAVKKADERSAGK